MTTQKKNITKNISQKLNEPPTNGCIKLFVYWYIYGWYIFDDTCPCSESFGELYQQPYSVKNSQKSNFYIYQNCLRSEISEADNNIYSDGIFCVVGSANIVDIKGQG